MVVLLFISVTLLATTVAEDIMVKEDPLIENSVETNAPHSQCKDGQSGAACSNEDSTYVLDLKEVFIVEYVMVYNREDCCLDSIIGAVIELLSESDNVLYTCGTITEERTDYNISCSNKLGSKIRLRHMKNLHLKFGKINVFGSAAAVKKAVISRGKPTWQSSIFEHFKSSLGADGIYENTVVSNYRNCFVTRKDKAPFWIVDLQGTFNIDHVVLYNRMDCCSNLLIGATVELLSESGALKHKCVQITESKAVYNISCGNKGAQKVRVRGVAQKHLHLCEVDVFGENIPISISRGKLTSQSSAYLGLSGSLAVDGKYDNNMTKEDNTLKKCFHTNLEENPFFIVDLQGPFDIDHVVIYNRMDCCSDSIIGAVVELLDNDGKKSHECGKINNSKAIITIPCGRKPAHKVRVRGARHQNLHFCEIDVFNVKIRKLISRGKPTSQSSVHEAYDSSLAVDGKYDNYINKDNVPRTCFITNKDASPYWTVDLQGLSNIDHVILYNRMDCCSEKIIGAVVELLSPSGDSLYRCGNITNRQAIYNISCGNVKAQMVRIRGAANQHLHLCEVDVIGDTILEPLRIISKGKPTNQSSTAFGLDSSLAVNGIYDSYISLEFSFHHNCFHTDNDSMPFWMVDLQGSFNIDHVSLYNRVDCCTDRIIGAVVELLNRDGDVIHKCGKLTESKLFYYIPCGKRIADKVRIRGAANSIMHLCEVDVFGESPQSRKV